MTAKTDLFPLLLEIQSIDWTKDNLLKKQGELPKNIERLEAKKERIHLSIERHRKMIKQQEGAVLTYQQNGKKAAELTKAYQDEVGQTTDLEHKEKLEEIVALQELEWQLSKKRMRKAQEEIAVQKNQIGRLKIEESEVKTLLSDYKEKLKQIKKEHKKQLEQLEENKNKAIKKLPERELLYAYERLRKKIEDPLTRIQEEACKGCCILVPLQQQIEVRNRKRVVFCGNCARIFVGVEEKEEQQNKK